MLRWAAAEKLISTDDVQRVAVESTDRQVLMRVLAKIGSQDHAVLNKIADSAAEPAMRLACAQKGGMLSWESIFLTASRDPRALGDALAAVALFQDVQSDAINAVQETCLAMIRRGDESRIPEMADLLEVYGDTRLAVDYLNCGQPDLYETGRAWAHKRGYSISLGSGSSRARWGSDIR